MNIKRKIGMWLEDERFRQYAERRMKEEITDVPENLVPDPRYEELDEGFERDDRYIVPLVEYLAYRLHMARLCRDPQKRRRGIWWVFVQISMQEPYKEFADEFEPLVDELQDCIIPMLHDEYVKKLNTEVSSLWS